MLSALLAAGCSGGDGDDDDTPPIDGSIVLTVGCASAGCGQTGTIRIPIRETNCEGPLVLTVTQPGVTTSAGNPFVRTIGLERSFHCVEIFLDVDTDGALSTGDVVPTDEIGVVQVGPGNQIGVTLDAIQ